MIDDEDILDKPLKFSPKSTFTIGHSIEEWKLFKEMITWTADQPCLKYPNDYALCSSCSCHECPPCKARDYFKEKK